MPAYRVYTIRDDGNFSNDSEFIECADDKEAIEKAMQTMNGYALEIWDHSRLIARSREARQRHRPPQLAASSIRVRAVAVTFNNQTERPQHRTTSHAISPATNAPKAVCARFSDSDRTQSP